MISDLMKQIEAEHAATGKIRVAVYGTLLAGERNAHWAQNALSRTPCTLRGTLYDTGFGYPAFVPAGGSNGEGREIAAEALEVNAAGLAHMDILEGWPNLYRREAVEIIGADGTPAPALVYVMNRLPAGAREIAGGDWRIYRKAQSGKPQKR